MSESDSDYLRRMGRDVYMQRPRGLVPQSKAFANIADRLDAKDEEIKRLRNERKRDCVDFFRWWFNQPGSNTEQGYEQWREHVTAVKGRASE